MNIKLVAAAAAVALSLPVAASAYVLGPTTPGKWGSPVFGTGATITYSYQTAGACDAGACVDLTPFMPAGFKTAMEAAFDAWAAVADLTFLEVVDDGADWNAPTTSGDIRITGHTFDGPGGVLAHGYYPPVNGGSAAGDIHFDIAEIWKLGGETGTIAAGPGFDVFQVMAHELGHALGLDHTLVPGSLMNAFYTEAFAGPQADDIAGMVYIYGPAATKIPVPAALPLMATGFALFGLVGIRRRKSKA